MLSVVLAAAAAAAKVEVVSLMVLVYDAVETLSNKYCGFANWVILHDRHNLPSNSLQTRQTNPDNIGRTSVETVPSNYLDINLLSV